MLIRAAFYNDGTGIILNYGEINLNGAEIDSTDSHYGAPAENLELLSELSASGENITKQLSEMALLPLNRWLIMVQKY